MKRNIMRAIVASALMISIVSVAPVAVSIGNESLSHQESVEAPSREFRPDASGIGELRLEGDMVAGREPGVGSGSTARFDADPKASHEPSTEIGSSGSAAETDANRTGSVEGTTAGSKPGVGVGSGGSTKPIGAVLAGGKGGIGGDTFW